MRRLITTLAALAVVLFSAIDARSGASSSTVVTSPDCLTTAPGAGCMYVQAQTLGVRVVNPTGQALGFTSTDIAGGGPVHVSNNGVDGFYGSAVNAIAARAIQLTNGGTTFLNTTTQIAAPDLSFASPTGAQSFTRVSAICGTGCDWTGGIAAPTAAPGTGNANGTLATLLNISGSGAAINILDSSLGGGVHVGPSSSIVLGYLETATFIYDSTGWTLWARGSGYNFNGGDNGGGRITTTTTSAVKALMSWVKGNAVTNGLAIQCDVSAKDTGSSSTGYWYGAKCAWDAANTQTLALTVANSNGNNAGAVPTGWALSCSDDASNHNLNVTTGAAVTVEWRANNCTQSAPPF